MIKVTRRKELRADGLSEEDISTVCCISDFVDKWKTITCDNYIHINCYRNKKDKRLNEQNKRLRQVSDDLIMVYGEKVYFMAMERLNNNL